MNLYDVTITVEFTVTASNRKQAGRFARQSIEDGCLTLEDGDMTIVQRHPTPALIDGADDVS